MIRSKDFSRFDQTEKKCSTQCTLNIHLSQKLPPLLPLHSSFSPLPSPPINPSPTLSLNALWREGGKGPTHLLQ